MNLDPPPQINAWNWIWQKWLNNVYAYFNENTGNWDNAYGWGNHLVTATTAELVDIADAINTGAAKVEGYQVFNTTTNAPVWAVGDTDGSVWVDATGSTAHTPA